MWSFTTLIKQERPGFLDISIVNEAVKYSDDIGMD